MSQSNSTSTDVISILPREILKEILSYVDSEVFEGEAAPNEDHTPAQTGIMKYRRISKVFSNLCLEQLEEIDFHPNHYLNYYDPNQPNPNENLKGTRIIENVNKEDGSPSHMKLFSLLFSRPFRLKTIRNLHYFDQDSENVIKLLSNCKELVYLSAHIDHRFPHRDFEEKEFLYDISEDLIISYVSEKFEKMNTHLPNLTTLDLTIFESSFFKDDKSPYKWKYTMNIQDIPFFALSRRDYQILVNSFKNEEFLKKVKHYIPALETLIINGITIFPLSCRGDSNNEPIFEDDENFQADEHADWPHYNMDTDLDKIY